MEIAEIRRAVLCVCEKSNSVGNMKKWKNQDGWSDGWKYVQVK
jgi:hypothetical protein